MNYFLHSKVYPILAKYKILYLYIGSIGGLLLLCFFWLNVVDNHLRKKIFFYETRLLDIQKKETELFTKATRIKELTETKEDLLLRAANTHQKVNTFWQSGTDILTARANANQLTIDSITITKQIEKGSYQKRLFSLILQGSISKIIKFLEEMQETKYVTLEHFSLHLEDKNKAKIVCAYAVQKIKTPSTQNKLKG